MMLVYSNATSPGWIVITTLPACPSSKTPLIPDHQPTTQAPGDTGRYRRTSGANHLPDAYLTWWPDRLRPLWEQEAGSSNLPIATTPTRSDTQSECPIACHRTAG